MEEAKAKLVFQKFKQIYEKNSIKTKRTGLGLAIVKELIELQGGNIYLETELNKGTTFFFNLPFEVTAKPASRETNSHFIEEFIDFEEKNILIAEDNPMNFKYLSTLLSKWRIKFKHAHDGREAIELLMSDTFDLVLMDIQMPYVDGYETTVFLRQTPGPNQHIPVVALTASAMIIEKNKAKDAGMDNVLTKPFTPNQLKRILDQYLNTNRKIKIEDQPMQTEYIDEKINQEIVDAYFGNDNNFKKIVFETFLEEIEYQIEEFKEFNSSENWDEIAKLGHKMKPSFAMVGLNNTEALLKSIESEIKANGINDQIKNRAKLFINNFPELLKLVKSEYNNLKN